MKVYVSALPTLLVLGLASGPSSAAAQVGSGLKDGQGSCAYRAGSRELVELRGHTDDKDVWTFTIEGVKRDARSLGYTQGNDKAWSRADRITIEGAPYIKEGLPLVMGASEMAYFAELDGVYVGKDHYVSASQQPDTVYVMMRSVGCEIQRYKRER